MSYLFKIENKVVLPNPETLLIYPFSEIWNRDKSKDKAMAIKEFSYIEFSTSMLRTNPYREYDDKRKHEVLVRDLKLDENWKPDEIILQCISKIEEFQTEGSISYNFWMSNKLAVEKMIEFFNEFDISERNQKTLNPIYKPKEITMAISDAEKVLKTLTTLKTKVHEELYDAVKNKANKEISPFIKVK